MILFIISIFGFVISLKIALDSREGEQSYLALFFVLVFLVVLFSKIAGYMGLKGGKGSGGDDVGHPPEL